MYGRCHKWSMCELTHKHSPHAVDGKHVAINTKANSGSLSGFPKLKQTYNKLPALCTLGQIPYYILYIPYSKHLPIL